MKTFQLRETMLEERSTNLTFDFQNYFRWQAISNHHRIQGGM